MKMAQAQKAPLVYTFLVADDQVKTPAENGNSTFPFAIPSLLPTVEPF